MRILVPGARGFLGRLVTPALEAAGHTVLRGSRRPYEPLRSAPDQAWHAFDLDRPATWDRSLDGVDCVVPLVRRPAPVLRRLAESARIPVIAVREADDLGDAGITTLVPELVIGEGSDAWTMCRDVALRSPVLVHPNWFGRAIRPVWQGDLVVAVCAAVEGDAVGTFAVPGSTSITVGDLIGAVASVRRMRHLHVPVGADLQWVGRRWLRWFTRVDDPVAARVLQQFTSRDPLPERDIWQQIDHRPVDVTDAVRRALRYEHKPARLPERLLEAAVRRAAGAGLKRLAPAAPSEAARDTQA